MGLQLPADRDESPDPRDLSDSLSELPEARIVRTPGSPREVLESDGASAVRAALSPERHSAGVGVIYPEWDYRIGAYRAHGAVELPGVAPAGAADWVDRVMAEMSICDITLSLAARRGARLRGGFTTTCKIPSVRKRTR